MTRSLLVLAAFSIAACADAPSDEVPAETNTDGATAISTAGPTVELSVNVEVLEDGTANVIAGLSTNGVEIVPAGDTTSGTGHHHLYLDEDLTPADQPVPTVPGRIIHMGDGSSSYTFTGVAPGPHRLIAVVADGVHVPLQPWVVDTVNFTVGDGSTDR